MTVSGLVSVLFGVLVLEGNSGLGDLLLVWVSLGGISLNLVSVR